MTLRILRPFCLTHVCWLFNQPIKLMVLIEKSEEEIHYG